MDNKAIEYVLALSKTLNFTRAASAVFTTQPVFSRVISNFENEIGITIFERNKRYVRLTPQGKTLVDALEKSQQIIQDGISRAQNQAATQTEKLVIGYIPDALNQDIQTLCDGFSALHPSVEICTRETFYFDLNTDLSSGNIDLAIFTSGREVREDFDCIKLASSRLCAIVHESHKLANYEEVSKEDLYKESFVVLAHDNSLSKNWGFVQQFSAQAQFTPHISKHCSVLASMVFEVSMNHGISITAERVRRISPDNVRLIPIKGLAPCHRCAVWDKQNHTPVLLQFLDYIKEQSFFHPEIFNQ